jgi:hypothetical protein
MIAARRPRAIPWVRIKRLSGPGATVIAIEAPRKVRRREVVIVFAHRRGDS